jgi:integrase
MVPAADSLGGQSNNWLYDRIGRYPYYPERRRRPFRLLGLDSARGSAAGSINDLQDWQTTLHQTGQYQANGGKLPRRAKGPRLYLDPKRRVWVIRDGSRFIRTGCAESNVERARKLLGRYLASQYEPQPSSSPMIADVLLAYTKEVIPHKRTARTMRYSVGCLERWWGDKTVADVTAINCRAYAGDKGNSGALFDLKRLQSAINHWHKEHGPLAFVPKLTMPPAPPPRTRWLTRGEVARLLWAARRVEYLKRLILLGLYTGSRPGVILALKWSQVDLVNGVLTRQVAAGALNKRAPPARLGRRILAFLRRWHRYDGHICAQVVHYDGKKMHSPHTSWDKACRRAGLRKVTPHTLRHTRATWLLRKGASLWDVAGHLGMTVKTLEATYGHHHPDHQGGVADL